MGNYFCGFAKIARLFAQGYSRAYDRNHPYGVTVWVADICDHLIEIRYRGFARERR
jgi:hypothetical protein